jgi:hypothetical protein
VPTLIVKGKTPPIKSITYYLPIISFYYLHFKANFIIRSGTDTYASISGFIIQYLYEFQSKQERYLCEPLTNMLLHTAPKATKLAFPLYEASSNTSVALCTKIYLFVFLLLRLTNSDQGPGGITTGLKMWLKAMAFYISSY